VTNTKWNILALGLAMALIALTVVLNVQLSERHQQTAFRAEARERTRTVTEEITATARRLDGFEVRFDTLTTRVDRIEDALRGDQ
jgi:CHASE1-domain containing sensor protein